MAVFEIPWQRLSPEALHGLLEEYINREGTDYGLHELTLEEKLENLLAQIRQGEVLVFYDEETESTQLLNREDRPGQ
jgi:uncharacterized protein YheU (UPF0270 family)